MLTQPPEHDKLGVAVRVRAPIDVFVVARALQVPIEPCEGLERGVAQETLVCLAVPRAFGRPGFRGRRRLVAAPRAAEHALGVRDVVVRVCAEDDVVEMYARHAGRAGARLEVAHERAVRKEGAVAGAVWAAHGGGLLMLRAQVVEQVVLVLEGPLAVGAVGVLVAVMFLELIVVVE